MLKNMKIQARLITSYLIIIFFLLVAGITSIIMINQVGASLTSFYDNQFQTVEQAWTARRSTYAVRAALLQAMTDDDLTVTQNCINTAKTEYQTINDAIASLRTTYQGDHSALDNLNSFLTQADPYVNQMYSLAGENRNDEAYVILTDNYMPIMNQLRTTLAEIADTADTNALHKVTNGKMLSRTAVIIILVISIVSVVVGVGLAILISNSLRIPIMEMRRVSEEVAAGNLDTSIDYSSQDELGDLANNMRNMTESVRTIIKDIRHNLGELADGNFCVESQAPEAYKGDYKAILTATSTLRNTMSNTLSQIDASAAQVNSGSEQVSSGAQALAQGATEQASSVEELAASINEISNHVKTTSSHAKTAKEENIHAHDEIQVCNAHMSELVNAMKVIEEKSTEVSKVVKTIEDIAFQTNILALNAAVEAARAGSAGKGFAVVADEVRNLASKSAEAAKNSTVLIQEAVQAVGEGTKISGETEESLKRVVADAQAVLDAVINISQATDEQSQAISQVSIGIDQISSVVQTNSATAEESAAASQELSGQANLLKELVDKFKLQERSAY